MSTPHTDSSSPVSIQQKPPRPIFKPKVVLAALKASAPAGPWSLTAISPKGGPTQTRTFEAGAEEAMIEWARARNETDKFNIYFSVARPRNSGLAKKAKKSDLGVITTLHVDADAELPDLFAKDARPTAAELKEARLEARGSVEAATAEVLARFEPENIEARSVPAPSFVVASGGGVGAFWILATPIVLPDPGSPEFAAAIEMIEEINAALASAFGAEAGTQNADRIMRIGGSINWPNLKKMRRGRGLSQASLIRTSDHVHSLSDFAPVVAEYRASTPKAEAKPPAKTAKKSKPADLSAKGYGFVRKHVDVGPDGLPLGYLDAEDRRIILEGAPKGSRSELALGILNKLVYAGLDDEQIKALFRQHGRFKFFERYSGNERLMDVDITKARKTITDEPMPGTRAEQLEALNDQWCVVVHGGKVRVVRRTRGYRKVGRTDEEHFILQSLSVADFKAALSGQWALPGPDGKIAPLAPTWLNWRDHSVAQGIVLDPRAEPGSVIEGNTDDPNHYFNTWLGWGVVAAKGDWHLLREMMLNVLCKGDEEHYEYLWKWIAWKLQHPGERPEVAVVLLGKKGSGKTTLFGEVVTKIFGVHGIVVNTVDHVAGKFSGHLGSRLFVFADDMGGSTPKQIESTLKRLITDATRMEEKKGIDAVDAENAFGFAMAANPGWEPPFDAADRRAVIFDVSDQRCVPKGEEATHPNARYWSDLYKEISSGGRAAFMHDALAADLGDWHPRRDMPVTEIAGQHALNRLEGYDKFVFEMLRDGRLGIDFADTAEEGVDAKWENEAVRIPPSALTAECAGWAKRTKSALVVSDVGLLRTLTPLGVKRQKSGSRRSWVFPPLPVMLAAWVKTYEFDPFDLDKPA